MRNGYKSVLGAIVVGAASLLAPVLPAAAQPTDTTHAAFMPLLRIAGEVRK